MRNEVKIKVRNLEKLRDESVKVFKAVFGPERDPRYDKNQFDFSTQKAAHDLHNVIYFRHHMGVYGNSTVSSAFPSELSKYIVQAINEQKVSIFNRAIELINCEIRGTVNDLRAERKLIDEMIEKIETGESK